MPPKRKTNDKKIKDSEKPKKKLKPVVDEDNDDDSFDETESGKIDSSGSNRTPSKQFNLKIISWNVNGIRAALKNGVMDFLNSETCDILCFQETKCNDKTFPVELKNWKTFPYKYYASSKQDGYAGVALFSKEKPNKVSYGIGIPEYDDEGRIITAYYDNFILVNAYVPNAGQGLKRLEYKINFDEEFREFLKKLDEEKPLILCGDLNVAHEEIDLENPKTNTKTAGFTPEERADFTKLLDDGGFIDSFRLLYPNRRKSYTYWGYRFNCRAKDIGWRLDYFVISQKLQSNLVDNQICKNVMGSDHCPIILYMNM